MTRRRARTVRDRISWELTMRWAIKISAPPGLDGDVWGDVYFAEDLALALRARGHEVFVDRLGDATRPDSKLDDVILTIHGMNAPIVAEDSINICWVISHPDWVKDDELDACDLLYAGSRTWSKATSRRLRRRVSTLLQATNPDRFRPLDGPRPDGIVFVGKSRGIFRPIIRDAIEAGARPTIYGDGWDGFIDTRLVRSPFLSNADVPLAYSRATVVLNDHWEDMRREGFLSNRLFDAVAAGAPVVTDDVQGLGEVFGNTVTSYRTVEELGKALAQATRCSTTSLRRAARQVSRRHSFQIRAIKLERDVARLLRRAR